MPYVLHRIDRLGARPAGARLGEFDDFDVALTARDDDVLAQLHARPAPRREISHLIVGPGVAGPATEHPMITFAGVDDNEPDPAAELAQIRRWLTALHRG